MKLKYLVFSLFSLNLLGCFNLKSEFTEIQRVYSPNGSKFLLFYRYSTGGLDSEEGTAVTIFNTGETVDRKNITYAYNSLLYDRVHWKANDTVIIEERFRQFNVTGDRTVSDRVIKGVSIKSVLAEPIDSSYTRTIVFKSTSPDNKHEVVSYRYEKPGSDNSFYNISIIFLGEEIPTYGNFYVRRFDLDCITSVQWNDNNSLQVKVSDECFYTFSQYQVDNHPLIPYTIENNDTGKWISTPGK